MSAPGPAHPAQPNAASLQALLAQPLMQEHLQKLVADGKIPPEQYAKIQQMQALQLQQQQAQAQAQAQAATPPPRAAGYKGAGTDALLVSTPATGDTYPAPPAALPELSTAPVAWAPAQAGRPSLTGGIPGGRFPGTPATVARLGDDPAMLGADDAARSRRKHSAGDQSMRRSIQDLVSSIDPNVKVEADVEDLLLEIADEFIDSVTNFGCRLAKHRGADTLEVKDLQLHLERNHNIRIPGFAADDMRMSLSAQTGAAPPAAKKAGGGMTMTLRSHRLSQVAQAKRDGKLL